MIEIREPDAATLEAVYNINKHAKKYARLADENYRKGKGATAKANSVKKTALYSVKSRAINRFLLDGADALTAVERHPINGEPFLCLYFEDEHGEPWAFHQPEDEVRSSRLPASIEIDPARATDGQQGSPSGASAWPAARSISNRVEGWSPRSDRRVPDHTRRGIDRLKAKILGQR